MQERRMGRPRKITDEDLIAAYYRVHVQMGPESWTLADIAREAGVVPATLIQRFGSKVGLMAAALRHGLPELEELPLKVLAESKTPLDAIYRVIPILSHGIDTPRMMANSLAQLHVEMTHDDLRPLVQAYTSRIRDAFRVMLEAAIGSGELAGESADFLSSIVYTTWSGALVTYGIEGSGPHVDWVIGAIERVLRPYLVQI